MDQLVRLLEQRFPQLAYRQGKSFYWSPKTKEIFYVRSQRISVQHEWSLLHETSHALLGHANYTTDMELVHLEVAAWEHAKILNIELKQKVAIDDNYIQDCVDSYREWLYRRCICPRCNSKNLQLPGLLRYQCFNCHAAWEVTSSRFCRIYRTLDSSPPVSIIR